MGPLSAAVSLFCPVVMAFHAFEYSFFGIAILASTPVRLCRESYTRVLFYVSFRQRATRLAGFGHDRCLCLARVGKVETEKNSPCFVMEVWFQGMMDLPGSFFNMAMTAFSMLVMGGWDVTKPLWMRMPIVRG